MLLIYTLLIKRIFRVCFGSNDQCVKRCSDGYYFGLYQYLTDNNSKNTLLRQFVIAAVQWTNFHCR